MFIVCGLLSACVIVATALAWNEDLYVTDAVYAAGDGNRSGYNTNLNGNAIYWKLYNGGDPSMCSEYVDSGRSSDRRC